MIEALEDHMRTQDHVVEVRSVMECPSAPWYHDMEIACTRCAAKSFISEGFADTVYAQESKKACDATTITTFEVVATDVGNIVVTRETCPWCACVRKDSRPAPATVSLWLSRIADYTDTCFDCGGGIRRHKKTLVTSDAQLLPS